MDDYGNDYQTDEWLVGEEQYSFSMATYGLLDDAAIDICIAYNGDYTAQEL